MPQNTTDFQLIRSHQTAHWVRKSMGVNTAYAGLRIRRMGRMFANQQLGAKVRVLVVEDDEALRELTATVLRYKGYEVVEAYSAEDALAKYQPGLFDIILCDIWMKPTDGFTFVRKLRDLCADLPPIVFYSSDADRKLEARKMGGSFLDKPARSHQLVAALESALRR